jgi:hypothetical protein
MGQNKSSEMRGRGGRRGCVVYEGVRLVGCGCDSGVEGG